MEIDFNKRFSKREREMQIRYMTGFLHQCAKVVSVVLYFMTVFIVDLSLSQGFFLSTMMVALVISLVIYWLMLILIIVYLLWLAHHWKK